jgi:hypothetical protein
MSAPIIHRSMRTGSGSPEASETGDVGDLYTRTSDGTVWVKATGAGTNTGWIQAGGGGAGDALVANPLSQFAATTSLQLKNTISDETGSGALVFATSPTLVTPLLGTPTSAAARYRRDRQSARGEFEQRHKRQRGHILAW